MRNRSDRLQRGLVLDAGDPGGPVEDDLIAPLDAEGDAGQPAVETGLEHLVQAVSEAGVSSEEMAAGFVARLPTASMGLARA